MSIDEAQLTRYGELVARLARPLADRSAVLWLARLDERGFVGLEQACLQAMVSDVTAGATFAGAYARTHALLEGEGPVDTGAATAPAGHVPAAQTGGPATRVVGPRPADAGTLASETPTRLEDTKAAPPPTDGFTLASVTNAITPRPGQKPNRGEPDEKT